MYRKHFGLKEKPFFKVYDHRFLYQSSQHKELMARLHFSVMEKEMAVVSGEIGSGKTTSCIDFIQGLKSKCKIAYLFNPGFCERDFLSEIIIQLGNEEAKWFRRNLLEQLQKAVDRCYDELNMEPIVLIDEAQVLSAQTLENIRLLTNYQINTDKLLTIILIGQPELKRKLSLNTSEAFNQRVGIKFHLYGLNNQETFDYIKHRLHTAGGDASIFTSLAIEKIYEMSNGLPRKINKLASISLLHACLLRKDTIDDGIIVQAAKEIE
ncbi:MAG: AAA family ATPase [Candidatus Omnitrophica bacterium]|nr:AAA family ATPase [Candidatus Omnitrophota bacterium]